MPDAPWNGMEENRIELASARLPHLAMALMKVGFRPVLLPETFDLDPSSQNFFLTLAGRVLVTDRPAAFRTSISSCGLGVLVVDSGAHSSRMWATAISRSWEAIQPRIGQGFYAAIESGGCLHFLDLG